MTSALLTRLWPSSERLVFVYYTIKLHDWISFNTHEYCFISIYNTDHVPVLVIHVPLQKQNCIGPIDNECYKYLCVCFTHDQHFDLLFFGRGLWKKCIARLRKDGVIYIYIYISLCHCYHWKRTFIFPRYSIYFASVSMYAHFNFCKHIKFPVFCVAEYFFIMSCAKFLIIFLQFFLVISVLTRTSNHLYIKVKSKSSVQYMRVIIIYIVSISVIFYKYKVSMEMYNTLEYISSWYFTA